MINVLLSFYDFGEGKLRNSLLNYIKQDMRVVVIPFSHSEQKMPSAMEYDAYCNKGGEYYELIAEQFGKLGIPYNNIDLVHYFSDDLNTMRQKLSNADILFFTGGLPDKTVERLINKNLVDTIKSFEGIIMGASAGALIQLSEYFCTPDNDYSEFGFYKGLGLLKQDFYVEVHYQGAALKDEFPLLKKEDKVIYAIANGAGLICDGENIEIIGDVTIFDH